MDDPVEKALHELEAEMAEAQRRVTAAWNEIVHAQNACARAQQRYLEAKLAAEKTKEAETR